MPFASCLLTFAFPTFLLPTAYWLLSLFPVLCFAQSPSPKPYAAINRDAVSYNGPGRDSAHDLAGAEIRVGLLAPLAGPPQAEGEALRHAAELAIEEENAASLPGGRRLALVIRDESGPWGQAATQISHMVFDDQAVALITSAEGSSAHLAEQIANKIGVPVLTLSTDSTTTEINLPWIFRLGPTDTAQARAFARDIYQNRKLQRVVLLSQDDHDGRVGSEEFIKAARELGAMAPSQIVVEAEKVPEELVKKELAGAQAVVIWADATTANRLAGLVRAQPTSVPLYLCRKAAEGDAGGASHSPCAKCGNQQDGGQWLAATPASPQARADFYQRYRQRFGAEPGIGAAQAYDAVRLLAASLRQSGPNRARLRDALDQVSAFAGASGIISFDHAGNDTSQVTILKLK
ncbi:MAG: ABC transporter substrate-binding protein [Terriglobia bacterium]